MCGSGWRADLLVGVEIGCVRDSARGVEGVATVDNAVDRAEVAAVWLMSKTRLTSGTAVFVFLVVVVFALVVFLAGVFFEGAEVAEIFVSLCVLTFL